MEDHKTVVVSGVPDVLSPGRMTDKLTIHFQSGRRSHGGDVQVVTYPTNMDGVAFVTFDQAEDAERVVRKERQIMTDGEFPEDYVLTVFPFSRDVFLYVASATVDLSVFGSDLEALIESLRTAHRSLRFQALPEQRRASIEGPFAAVQALREDLIRRASRLKSTAGTTVRETPLNPRIISQCSSVGSVSGGGGSLSTLQQSAGEVSLLTTQKASSRQKVADDDLVGGSFQDGNEDELSTRSRLRMSMKCRAEPTEVNPRQVEINAGIISSLSDDASAASSLYSSTDLSSSSVRTKLTDVSSERRDLEDIWVDSYTFRYIKKFHKKELDRCLGGIHMSAECVGGSGLMRITLTESQTSPKIREASENLKSCVEFWTLMLRVHEILYEEAAAPDKQKLIQICDEENYLENVLYVLEDSHIKVVGPSVSSHLFCKRVEDRIHKLTGAGAK